MLKVSIPLFTAVALAVSAIAPPGVQAAEEMNSPPQFWWPQALNLAPLRAHDDRSDPYGNDFDYAKAFSGVDLDVLKEDIAATLKNSQDWWPADWGTYGGLMIRMAWHSAGTYRVSDGRGGADGAQQRFLPLNSWPDNVSLDKARRLLWPVKQKYGRNVSWADLITLAGNVSLESMGFETIGFAGGRVDDWESDAVYWGAETKWLANDKRYDKDGKLENPLAAVQMGLIYVNPEGPNGNSDPIAAAADIRESFGRMAMNDEETVALIAGGHTLGKAHGAKPVDCLGPAPADAPIEQQGLGWKNKCGTGTGADAMTSGLEGAWTSTPTAWSILYLDNLFRFDWKKVKSPAGATQWIPTDESVANMVPDAHDPDKRHAPIMFTTDLALKEDPSYKAIAERFRKNPKEFDLAFAKAWFKLTHRDMGPRTRYLGSEIPEEVFIWQDPVPAADYTLIDARDAANLKANILKSGLTVPELVRTAWASASTYRDSDKRGGANGARIRLEPQKDWAANNPGELASALKTLTKVQEDFNKSLSGGKQVSLADVIVLGGAAGVEQAAKEAGVSVEVPFTPGRTDTSQQMTDASSFAVLEPTADAFRNYYSDKSYDSPANMLVEKANLLTLTVPEMTALLGGMRVLNANTGQTAFGVFTDQPGTLDNKFFINLLDMSTVWSKSAKSAGVYEGRDRASNDLKWTATPVDLVFGSNSELRAVAEAYATSNEQFINEFVAAWSKVMTLDRFDLNKT